MQLMGIRFEQVGACVCGGTGSRSDDAGACVDDRCIPVSLNDLRLALFSQKTRALQPPWCLSYTCSMPVATVISSV